MHRSTPLAVIALSSLAFVPAGLFAADLPDLPGLHNFHQVDDHVYRGAQPSMSAFADLAKMGIKTIVDLRETGSRSVEEKKVVEAAGMHYLSVPLAGYGAPPTEVVAKLMALFADTSAGPVFIHCRRGADRTGTIVAVYRMLHDHWENAKALAEAKANGMSWTERAMQHYILSFEPTKFQPSQAVAAADKVNAPAAAPAVKTATAGANN